MSIPSVPARRWLPWLAPLVVAAAVLAGVLLVGHGGSTAAARSLPPLSARQLLVDVQQHAPHAAFSGTVRETANLGLPPLPDLGGGSDGPLGWPALLHGSHQAQLWMDGLTRQRMTAVENGTGLDIVHNARDVWTYRQGSSTVKHVVLSAHRPSGPGAGLDPTAIAQRILGAITPSTNVSVSRSGDVAGQRAYVLTLAPKDAHSTVRQITVAVDGTHFVPLRVQVFAKGRPKPVLDVGFVKVSFQRPATSAFTFTVPKGATVSTENAGRHAGAGPMQQLRQLVGRPTLLGSGWTTVAKVHLGVFGAFLANLGSAVPGTAAKLVHTAIVNVLVQPDGTTYAGAVTPDWLEHVAGVK